MSNIVIENKSFDEERALYHLMNAQVKHCTFAGPADGESALKEAHHIEVEDCTFSLRYPFWHTEDFRIARTTMDEKTRAALWYARRGVIENSRLGGIKCLRECEDIRISDSEILSPEFGWRCRGIELTDSRAESEYFLFESSGVTIRNLTMKGKYSYQYVENMEISDSLLDTKDAFWHSKNVTVRDTLVKGEYLGWYSENLTLINCRITGTQPLCYCKGLKLVNCTMEDTDLSFEYSEVEAEIRGHIVSVKNPKSGFVKADSIGEIIREDAVMECNAEILCG